VNDEVGPPIGVVPAGGEGGAVLVTIGAAARAWASPLIVDEGGSVDLWCSARVGAGIE
jgi:hypothetical protein